MQDNVCHVIMQKAETFHSYEYLAGQTGRTRPTDTINRARLQGSAAAGAKARRTALMLSPRRNSMSNLPVQ